MTMRRRGFLQGLAAMAAGMPLLSSLNAEAAGQCERVIFFYFPDGVVGASQNGDPSQWHCTGSEHNFNLAPLLQPLAAHKNRCVFFRGLSMGPTDQGNHPGGAKKLLTATDYGNGPSIDQVLAKSIGASAPWQHLYLGVQANVNNASGDKHIVYPSAGQSIPPEDDPRTAFSLLFGNTNPGPPSGDPAEPDPIEVSVIDGVLDDMHQLRQRLGGIERSKLDLHLEGLREVEKRIKNTVPPLGGASCEDPQVDTMGVDTPTLYQPESFPTIMRAQLDLMVLAMQCGLTRVGTLQAAHHTSDLVMSRFPGTEMYDPNFDMRSHQASHYGASHDPNKAEFVAFQQHGRYWASQLAYLLDRLASLPEGDGTMLDHSLVVLCTEVCDGNTHLHDDMPFILAGGAGGAFSTGRLLDVGYRRHADLWLSVARAMGSDMTSFGDNSAGPIPGL